MRGILWHCVIAILALDGVQQTRPVLPEDSTLNFTGLAAKYGHPARQYEVTTEDGYIVTLFRIPGRSRYPILLVHGLADTSDSWLLRGEESLGIALAEDGYDVWYGNVRGNRYSRRHLYLNPDTDQSYWEWSFHEIAYYDLPAIIDTILMETRKAKLAAVGHSQGNTIFFILGAVRPEYNEKFSVMASVAPVCYLNSGSSTAAAMIDIFQPLSAMYRLAGINASEILGYGSPVNKAIRAFCTATLFGSEICLNFLIFPLMGFDPVQIDLDFVSTFIYHFPAGTSLMSILHYSQLKNIGVFARYDFGVNKNLRLYKSPTPPAYNLSKITMPVALLVARNDYLSTLPDVALLRRQLPNVVDYKINRWRMCCHVNYIWGNKIPRDFFPDIFPILKRYSKM